MTAPHIVDPHGLLGEALAEASPDLMRSMLQQIINELLSADADAVVGAYSSQYNGTDADFSATGGLGWLFGVTSVLFVGAVYHLALLPVGYKAYRANGLWLALIAAGVSAGLYAFQIIPAAIASGGPESFVP